MFKPLLAQKANLGSRESYPTIVCQFINRSFLAHCDDIMNVVVQTYSTRIFIVRSTSPNDWNSHGSIVYWIPYF